MSGTVAAFPCRSGWTTRSRPTLDTRGAELLFQILTDAKRSPPSPSPRTSPSAADGDKSSQTHASSPPSSTASPSASTSSKPAPSPTDSAPPANAAHVGLNQPSTPEPIRVDTPMRVCANRVGPGRTRSETPLQTGCVSDPFQPVDGHGRAPTGIYGSAGGTPWRELTAQASLAATRCE